MSLVKKLDRYRTETVRCVEEFNTDEWVFNLILKQRFSFLGLGFWKTVETKTFTFPRYSDSPFGDGLANYRGEAKAALGLIKIAA